MKIASSQGRMSHKDYLLYITKENANEMKYIEKSKSELVLKFCGPNVKLTSSTTQVEIVGKRKRRVKNTRLR